MDRWLGKVAVVTGASSGIGLATCQRLVREGLTVVGLARRKEKMEEAIRDDEGKGKFYPVKCDITNGHEVIQTFKWITKNVGIVQIMINNAGVLRSARVCDMTRTDWEHIFNVNVMGLLDCTKHAVNIMKNADVEGYVININSTAGHEVLHSEKLLCNVYSASKFAVTAITKTLHYELNNTNIRVTSLSPGSVQTEIFDNVGFDLNAIKYQILNPEDIADAIAYAIGTPMRVQIAEMTIQPLGEMSQSRAGN